MTNPTQAQIDKLTTNLGRWDDIVNGSETDTVTLDNSTVKTVSGYLAELKAYNSLGAWQTAYSYSVKDVVSESSVLYVCLVAHTSGTFATDLASGKWAILQTDFQNLNVSGTFSGTFSGTLTGDVTGTATNATHVTVVDNESENENNLIPFIENGTATGNVGLESDGDFHYNPSTGTLTATLLAGTLSTASQPNITAVGTLSTLTVSGDATFDTSVFKVDASNDRVGIGLSSPSHRLDVDDSSLNSGNVGTVARIKASGTSSTAVTVLNVQDSFYVNGSGNIGVGTSSPVATNSTFYDGALLHVHQSNSATGRGSQIRLTNTATGYSSSDGSVISQYYNQLYIQNMENDQIRIYTNGIECINIATTGIVSGDFNDTSDISLKKNVRNFEKTGLEIIKEIKPRIFDWKQKDKGNNIFGFIAQELEEVMPTAVIQGDVKSINVTSIVSVLVHSVKELKKELDALKNK